MSLFALLATALQVALVVHVSEASDSQPPDPSASLACERALKPALGHLRESAIRDSAALEQLYQRFLKKVENLKAYISPTGALHGKRVHIIHKTGQRDRNRHSKSFKMAGTEVFLRVYEEILFDHLQKEPGLGELLYNEDSYKNNYVVSDLDAVAFRQRVLNPVKEKAVARLSETIHAFPWKVWMDTNIYHAAGDTPVDAHARVALVRASASHNRYLSLEEWRNEAIHRRLELWTELGKKVTDWDLFLKKMHQYLDRGQAEEKLLAQWFKEHGFSEAEIANLFPKMRRYNADLQVADFHPLPGVEQGFPETMQAFIKSRLADPLNSIHASWDVEQQVLYQVASNAGYVLSTDMRNFSFTAKWYRDKWIEEGAHFESLPRVYRHTTAALNSLFKRMYSEIKTIFGENSQIYFVRSGDDGSWLLPRIEHKDKKGVLALRKLRQYLQKLMDGERHESIAMQLYYSRLIVIDRALEPLDAILDAQSRSRDSLDQAKRRVKKEEQKKAKTAPTL
ncbi:MAG: hypothetical protein AB1540_10625 [Bdellovibrionota bacterium]